MTIEEVKKIINNSKYDATLKQRLGLVLPRLGKYTLSGLGKEVSRGDSVRIADYLVSLWESFANLLGGLRNKTSNLDENLSKFLDENLTKFNGEDELHTLNFVLDVLGMYYSHQAKITTEQYQKLLDFEIQLYWQLPKEEILFLLGNRVLFLLQKTNLLKDTQVAVYQNGWDYNDKFNKFFLDTLLQNNEVLGVNTSKTIGAWIKEYLNFTLPLGSQASTFGVAEFFLKDVLVEDLTNIEKEFLSEILKLFIWLLEPQIDEENIRNYKEEINNRRANKLNSLLSLKEISNQKQNIGPAELMTEVLIDKNVARITEQKIINASHTQTNRSFQIPSLEVLPPPAHINKQQNPSVNIKSFVQDRPTSVPKVQAGIRLGQGEDMEHKTWSMEQKKADQEKIRQKSIGQEKAEFGGQALPVLNNQEEDQDLMAIKKRIEEQRARARVKIDEKLEELKDRTKN